MPTLPVSLYNDGARPERVLIGVSLDATLKRATAVRLRVTGRGLGSRTEIETTVEREFPEALAHQIDVLSSELPQGQTAGEALQTASEGVARLAASLAEEACRDGCEEPLAIGVADLTVLGRPVDELPTYLPICDSALAAELSGLTVIDSFAARDLAQGGQGKLIDVLAYWILLHDSKKPRVLVDLGDITRLIYLPASCEASGAQRVLFFAPGPAMDLWDQLSARFQDRANVLPSAEVSSDEQSSKFLEIFDRDSGRHTEPADCASFDATVQDLVDFADEQGWSLATAQRCVAGLITKLVGRTVLEKIPKTPPLQEIILTGRGAQEKLLSVEIAASQPDLKSVTLKDLGLSQESLAAATTAVLALLHLEQVPATSPMHSGVNSPRVLGRLTPGSPQNWRRVLAHLAENRPTMVSLRSAI